MPRNHASKRRIKSLGKEIQLRTTISSPPTYRTIHLQFRLHIYNRYTPLNLSYQITYNKKPSPKRGYRY